MTKLLAVHLSPASTAVRAGSPRAPGGTMRVDYYHTGNAKEERFSLDRVVARAAAVAGQSGAADRRHQSRQVPVRGRRRRERTRAVLARVQLDLRRVGDDRRSRERSNRTFSESLRFPAPDKPVRIVVKKRDARNVFRDVWTLSRRSGRQVRRAGGGRAGCGRADQAARERRSGDEARPPDSRRRLHRARARPSSSATRGGWSPRCSRPRRSRSGSATSTSGACVRRRRSRASRVRRSTSTGGRRSAPPTTRSIPSATC